MQVTVRHGGGDDDVNMHSIIDVDNESGAFYSRVKCFPLFTIMLAVNQTNINLLSLGCTEQDLNILDSVPFDQVNIKIITIYVKDSVIDHDTNEIGDTNTMSSYINNFTTFLKNKSYRLVKVIEGNHIFIKN